MSQGSGLVLVVNDDEEFSGLLRVVLERAGYVVDIAEDGWEALCKLYEGLRPCVILLDFMMPVMNGEEFREQQLKMPEIANIPVIVMSAIVDVHSTAWSHLRADGFIKYPLDPHQLLDVIRRHCAGDGSKRRDGEKAVVRRIPSR